MWLESYLSPNSSVAKIDQTRASLQLFPKNQLGFVLPNEAKRHLDICCVVLPVSFSPNTTLNPELHAGSAKVTYK
jgi:hypothetical protein